MTYFHHDLLREFCLKILTNLGVSQADAYSTSDNLVSADLRGVDSHGVSRMPIYVERIENGLVSKKSNFTIIKEHRATLMIDAKNSMGAAVSVKIMKAAIEKAKSSGVALVTVNNSNHFGMASYFASMALEHSFIGFATTNAPSTMAPYGGIEPYFGTNPIACAIPSSSIPVVVDMATSVVARGKIILAAKKGDDIPLNWAITKSGEPTTNAKEALEGTVLPFAGPKGYAFAMLSDIFSGILSGGLFGPQINNLYSNNQTSQKVGHFFAVVDPDCFIGRNELVAQVDEMIKQIKISPKAKGVKEIFIPGEIEFITMKKREEEGIPLSIAVVNDLKCLGEQYGVPFINEMKH